MAKRQNFTIKESLSELKKLRKDQKYFAFEKRILWLLYIKENKFKTKAELCNHLDIHPRTQQRWIKQYREEGIQHLLSDLSNKRKSKIITPNIHKALEQRLNDDENGFLGYRDAQQWVNEKFGIDVQYHWLRKYLTTHFKTTLKSAQKSHSNKTYLQKVNS